MTKAEQGFLLIADITGYTGYLSKSELEHAEETLTALLELLVKHTKPPLVISRTAGDAVISYGLKDRFFQGQTFVEVLENTYFDFKKAIEVMAMNNTCKCRACANITNLDLKFFVHFGTFAIQHITDHDQLVGSDVNQIHRLLKNSVVEKTGFKAYALYTGAALKQLGIEEMKKTMKPVTESYEHLGKVKVWIQNMEPLWNKKKEATKIVMPEDRILKREEVVINLQPEIVWDYLSRPEFRRVLWGADEEKVTKRNNGRINAESVYLCYHGTKVFRHTIQEWQPFVRIVTKDYWPAPFSGNYCLIEYVLKPKGKGTRFIQSETKANGSLMGRIIVNMLMSIWALKSKHYINTFKKLIEEDYLSDDKN